MKTVLITGANKSIGLETARQLLQHGYHVYLGSRDLAKAASRPPTNSKRKASLR
ncbi:MAG: SDR family NAD(P)-dependent oxidoreductase [Hymenobacter sp.]